MGLMKQIRFLAIMAGLSALMFSACSSDDSDNSESEKIAVLSPLDAAANKLNKNLEGLDFKELDPLAETVVRDLFEAGDYILKQI